VESRSIGDTPDVIQLLTIVTILLVPSFAFAASREHDFVANIVMITVLGAGLAVVLNRVLKSRGLPSGLEFVALGYLIGPVLNLIPDTALQLWVVVDEVQGTGAPTMLGVGLAVICVVIGLFVSFSLDFRWFRDWELDASAEAIPILLSVPVLLLGVTYWIHTFYPIGLEHVALVVGGAAVITAVDLRPAHIYLTHFNVWGDNRLFGLRVGTTLQAAAIFAAGVAQAMLQTHMDGKPPTHTAVLIGIQIMIAVLVGVVARSVSPLRASNSWTLSVAIAVALFLGPLAIAMGGSGLLMGLVAGLVWVQFDRDLSTLSRPLEPVIHAALLVLAGLVWSSNPEPWVFVVVVGWLIMRWVVLRFYQTAFRRKKRPIYGLLWPAGVLGIAIVLELRLAAPPFEAEWSTGMLLAILISELISRRIFRNAMIDQGTFAGGRS